METKRLAWIDMAKGYAMILVMFGHAPFPDTFIAALYTFHLPLFFFLSGYLFSGTKYNTFKTFIKSKFKALIIPYFCLSFIEYIYFYFASNRENISPLKSLIGTFYAVRDTPWTYHNATMWFIPCLFIAELIFFFIAKYTGNNSRKIIACLIFSSIIGYYYSIYIKHALPWSADTSLNAVVFYGIGYLIKGKESKLSRFINLRYLSVFLIGNAIFGYLNYHYLGERIDMFFSRYGNYLFLYGAAISGIMAALIIIRLLPKLKLLIYVGKNSLIFLAFHQMILFPIIGGLTRHIDFFHSRSMSVLILQGITYVVISYIVLVPIIYIINNYMPFLLGRGFHRKSAARYLGM